MTVQNARPCSFTQLTTDADWEMLVSTYGLLSGVRGAPGASYLAPSLDTGGRNIDIAAGSAIIRGRLWSCDATVATSIPAASASDRIDRLVLRLDRGAVSAATVIQPVVIEGTPAAVPIEPVIQRTSGGLYDIPIASWRSQASGGLTSLADERVFTGSAIVAATSNELPVLTEPGLLIETDTGRVRISRFAGTWDTIIYDPPDSWHTLSLKNGWSRYDSRGVPRYRLSADKTFLELAGQVTGTTDGSSSDTIAILPAGYFDSVSRDVPIAILNDNLPGTGSPRVFLSTAGNLQIPGYSSSGVLVNASLDGVRIPVNT